MLHPGLKLGITSVQTLPLYWLCTYLKCNTSVLRSDIHYNELEKECQNVKVVTVRLFFKISGKWPFDFPKNSSMEHKKETMVNYRLVCTVSWLALLPAELMSTKLRTRHNSQIPYGRCFDALINICLQEWCIWRTDQTFISWYQTKWQVFWCKALVFS